MTKNSRCGGTLTEESRRCGSSVHINGSGFNAGFSRAPDSFIMVMVVVVFHQKEATP
jgi:hypothetical protein